MIQKTENSRAAEQQTSRPVVFTACATALLRYCATVYFPHSFIFLGACDKKAATSKAAAAKLLRRLLHRAPTQKGLRQWKK